MIRNQKIKGTLTFGPLISKWMGVLQSWLYYFSNEVSAFVQNINFLSSVVFLYWCPFVTIITLFQVHQTASDTVPIIYNKSCTSTGY